MGARPATSFAVDAAGVPWSWGGTFNGGLCQGEPYVDPDPIVPTAFTRGAGGPPFTLGHSRCDQDDDHRRCGEHEHDDDDD